MGDADVVGRLLDQHARISELFYEVRTCVGGERQQAFQVLRALIAVHETAEDMIVRPVTRRVFGDREADARAAEERQMLSELEDLSRIGIDDPEFAIRLASLEMAVHQHAEAEEGTEFPTIELCPADQRESMRRQLGVALELAPTRPHPGLVGREAAVLTIGPIGDLIDRTRDAIRKASR